MSDDIHRDDVQPSDTRPDDTHRTDIPLDPVQDAVAALAAGRPVVVVDDADRENEGDLIYSAALATEAVTAFTVRYTSGVICAPLPAARADRLALPPMTARNEDPKGTAYTVSVDALTGVSTGISAADRTATLRALAGEDTVPGDLTRPGHVFPLRAVPGGVRARRGHTEAGVELCTLAGLPPVAAIAELVHDDGAMMRLPALRAFADEHGLVLISIEDLVTHLDEHHPRAEAVEAAATLPTRYGTFRISVHPDTVTGAEHVLLVAETAPTDGQPLAVRVHSECLTGDLLGSLRCDCGPQLEDALRRSAAEGGAVLYLRGHEGRGVGLAHKIRAYRLQEEGMDTVEANLALGLPAESRDYAGAAAVLLAAGHRRIRLITNNPAKVAGLRAGGVDVVERIPAPTPLTEHNARYLRTKRDRMDHALADRDLGDAASGGDPTTATTDPITTTQEETA